MNERLYIIYKVYLNLLQIIQIFTDCFLNLSIQVRSICENPGNLW